MIGLVERHHQTRPWEDWGSSLWDEMVLTCQRYLTTTRFGEAFATIRQLHVLGNRQPLGGGSTAENPIIFDVSTVKRREIYEALRNGRFQLQHP